jgi:uncharacterized protein (TIGR02145 family)/prepilin-type N-terminal cleavage/methylation domain-containing protein
MPIFKLFNPLFLLAIRRKLEVAKNAFTLVELLVVIAIIAILAAIILVFTQGPQASARDSRRQSDLSQIRKSLQAYYLANNSYPATDSDGISLEEDSAANGTFTQAMKGSGYMSVIPKDPKYTTPAGEYAYKYIATSSDFYTLCAKSEAKGDYFCIDQESIGISQTSTAPVFTGWGGGSGGGFVCGVTEVEGAGGLTYGTVLGPDGKCWLDRNLGATQAAVTSADVASYGYYYQWGRPTDGHQIPNSATTSINSSSDTPGHANFITESASPYDWRVPQSPNEATLWAGANGGSNNVCPAGWHVPAQSEWATVAGYFSPQTSDGAFDSSLKLPLAGHRSRIDAVLGGQGSGGWYWSSSPEDPGTWSLSFYSGGVDPNNPNYRAYGLSVRCIKD